MDWLFGGSLSGECRSPLNFWDGFAFSRRCAGSRFLSEDGMDDFPGDVCEPKFAPLKSIGEAFVVDA